MIFCIYNYFFDGFTVIQQQILTVYLWKEFNLNMNLTMKKQKISLNLRKQKVSLVSGKTTKGGRNNYTADIYQCVTLQTYCGIACQTTLLTNQTGCCELSRLVC
ncbi:hypothetical protein [uncultured Kordia sp.]|uniref:hypothetical protein n=1 Tax=uncultured Kordia sp. TaxID=507699 RepID=UPI00261C6713|nr:hypothetical protein [uncultured Kordia sp.]